MYVCVCVGGGGLKIVSDCSCQQPRLRCPNVCPVRPGRLQGGKINQKGVDFYNRMIDSMLENGVQPAATLYHW